MSQYTGDVIARTILIPGFLLGALTFGASYALKKFNVVASARNIQYQEHQTRVEEIANTKKLLDPFGPKLKEWKVAASEDTRTQMDKTNREIKQELGNSKLIITDTKDEKGSPFGEKKENLRMRTYTQKWEGTFLQIGKLLVRIEERNPTLHLNSLALIQSSSGMLQNPGLTLDVSWTAFEGVFKINQNYGEDNVIQATPQTPTPPNLNAK